MSVTPTGARLAPTADELHALADKYRTLAALRARRDGEANAGPARGQDRRQTLRRLAVGHPGALRELDTLGEAELHRRAEVAARAAADGIADEPWLSWIAAYHRLMGAALEVKRATARGRRGRGPIEDAEAAVLAARASAEAALPIDAETARIFARPPQGRLVPLVLERVAWLFGVAPEAVRAALFPTRRASPYSLGDRIPPRW